jgi:hypothetical protein
VSEETAEEGVPICARFHSFFACLLQASSFFVQNEEETRRLQAKKHTNPIGLACTIAPRSPPAKNHHHRRRFVYPRTSVGSSLSVYLVCVSLLLLLPAAVLFVTLLFVSRRRVVDGLVPIFFCF